MASQAEIRQLTLELLAAFHRLYVAQTYTDDKLCVSGYVDNIDKTIVVIGKYVDGAVPAEAFGVTPDKVTNLDKPALKVVPKEREHEWSEFSDDSKIWKRCIKCGVNIQ